MNRTSIFYGTSSLALSVGWFLLRSWMEKLPFGVNDFDPILLGIVLLSIGMFIFTILITLIGLKTGGVYFFRKEQRWKGFVGFMESVLASMIIIFTLWYVD
jgi:hypothetical protein